MIKRKVYLWIRTSNKYNSMFIQACLLADAIMEIFGLEAEVLHPGIKDVQIKIDQIIESDNVLLWLYGGLDSLLIGRKMRPNVIMIYHNITPVKYLWNSQPLVAVRSILGSLQLKLMNKGYKWITMSPYNANELKRFGFIDISICHNIVTTSNVEDILKTEHISLLFVGRISPNKNCLKLLEHAEKAANILRRKIEFNIIGSTRPGCRHGKQFINKYLQLKEHQWLKIKWVNSIDENELHKLYKKSWLYITMSLHEGFGLPVCESIACGTPALYLECGGQESILHNLGMVPKNQMDEFAAHIVGLIQSKDGLNDLLLKQKNIVTSFIRPAIDREIEQVYKDIN